MCNFLPYVIFRPVHTNSLSTFGMVEPPFETRLWGKGPANVCADGGCTEQIQARQSILPFRYRFPNWDN